ncbi:MAG: hypothetical protein M1824_005756 [Vezdaea acicularis]|nr:MAG: hypothetical protein M1824_005756 [Vezdaea acicularis]
MGPSVEPPPPYTRHDPNSTPSTSTTTPSLTVTTAPSHDYSSHSQASPSLVADGFQSPASSTVVTPPASPSPYDGQNGHIGDSNDESATELYFRSRPCMFQISGARVIHTIQISPETNPETLPFPSPSHRFLSRDVTEQDWDTFRNFLFPEYQMMANLAIVERKMQAELDRREEELPGANINEAPADLLLPAQLYVVPGVEAAAEKRSAGQNVAQADPNWQERIESMVLEWNEGFFNPRGIVLDAIVIPPSPVLPRHTPATSDLSPVELPASVPSYEPVELPIRGTSPRSCDSLPQTCIRRKPLPYRSATAPSSSRPDPVRTSTESIISPTSPPGLMGNADSENPASNLRTSIAKALLAPKGETNRALEDLWYELMDQKMHNIQAIKKELGALKKEKLSGWQEIYAGLKVLAKEDKEKQKAETKRWQDSCKADRKAWRDSMKETHKLKKKDRDEYKKRVDEYKNIQKQRVDEFKNIQKHWTRNPRCATMMEKSKRDWGSCGSPEAAAGLDTGVTGSD